MEFVYTQLLRHRADGCGILLISSDLEEVRALSDRIAVLVSGRIPRILDATEADLEVLGLLMAGSGDQPG
jgi:simple sugar transport system ATP-binding protein